MNQNISNYTFTAATKEITLTGITVNVEKVRLIKNLTTNTFIYKFTDALSITTVGSVITFTADNTGMANTDKLLIQYDLETSIDSQKVLVDSSVLPTNAATETTLALINNKLPTAIVDMPSVDTPSIPVRTSPQKYIDCSFSNVGSGLLTSDFVQKETATGMTISQSAGNLVIATGTTVNAEFVARSLLSVNGALTLKSIVTLSQRIVNNNFFIELVDVIGDLLVYNIVNTTTVDVTKVAHGFTAQNVGQRMDLCALSSVGVPQEGVIASIPNADTIRFTVAGYPASGSGTLSLTGYNKIELLYNGTTATNNLFNTRRKGWQNTAATATINTTASGHLVSVNSENGITSLSDKTLAAGNALTDRMSWDANIPQPDVNLYIQLRAKNGTTAPASTTTWTIGMVRVEDYIPTQVSMVSTRQQTLNNSTPVRGTVTATQGAAAAGAWLTNPLTPAVSTTGDTGAKVATGNGATQTNATAKGALVVINLGAVTGTLPTGVFKIQGSADNGTTWLDLPLATTASLTVTGVYGIQIYPALTPTAGAATTGSIAIVNSVLPRTWRVVWTLGGTTPSFTITNIQVNYLI